MPPISFRPTRLAVAASAALATADVLWPAAASGSSEEKYSYFVEVEIEIGKRTFVEDAGYDIAFAEVLEDTRCPADVECVQPGNARILLRFVPGMGPNYSLELDTLPTGENEAFLSDGTGARLLDLRPLPTIDGDPDPAEYVVSLLIFEYAE